MKPSELLADAQGVLRQRGLAYRTLYHWPTGRVCADGALNIAAGAYFNKLDQLVVDRDDPTYQRAVHYLLQHLTLSEREGYVAYNAMKVGDWNDTQELNDVLAAFHEAEMLAKENGE